MAVTSAPCSLALSGVILFIPAPFIIADIPLSAIIDTLLLPWDLAAEDTTIKRRKVTGRDTECGIGIEKDSQEDEATENL